MRKQIILGTRGSNLALVQAEKVKTGLNQLGIKVFIKVIKTSGDILKDANLADIGGKELFTKEIDEALLNGEIDIAVHSLKDVPGIIPDKIKITACLPREDARDCLLGAKSLAELPHGAKIGTSSPRRKAQLLHIRPDLEIVHFRGNVGTRIKKLQEKQVDATLLAIAGIKRLHINPEYQPLTMTEMLPAAGQGIIAIATRKDDEATKQLCAPLNHHQSFTAAMAERAVITAYGGNCYTPLGAYAEVEKDKLTLTAMICATDGRKIFKTSASGTIDRATLIGLQLGNELLDNSKDFT